MERNLMKLL